MGSLVVLHLLAAAPKMLDAFNGAHVDPKLVQENGKWFLVGSGLAATCAKKPVTKLINDDKNGYLHFISYAGDCSEEVEHTMAAFTLPDGAFMWMETETRDQLTYTKCYVEMNDSFVNAPVSYESQLPGADLMLPKGFSPKDETLPVLVVLPQHGIEVTSIIQQSFVDQWCKALKDKERPAECAKDSKSPLRKGLKSKWNVKEGKFDPPH
jgi:hypothetical protein